MFVTPKRLSPILGGCRPGRVSGSCFRNLPGQSTPSQLSPSHRWERISSLLSPPAGLLRTSGMVSWDRSSKTVQPAWSGKSDFYVAVKWATPSLGYTLSSVSSRMFSLWALERSINDNENNRRWNGNNKDIWVRAMCNTSLIPYPYLILPLVTQILPRGWACDWVCSEDLPPAGQQEWVSFDKWGFFFPTSGTWVQSIFIFRASVSSSLNGK